MGKTTIQVNQSTLERLKSMRINERQSYDDLLNSIINEVEEEPISKEEIEEIKMGLDDIKRGKLYPIESIAKELGIILR